MPDTPRRLPADQGRDSYDLARFVTAQAPVYEAARAELAAGLKRSHWIWFVFPQMRGLGHSETAHRYGIASLDEARAYLAHPLLGPRLIECTRLVLGTGGRTLHEIFGSPDDLKFRSSMTLFALAAGEGRDNTFREALEKYCNGAEDAATRNLLDLG